jgi:hypothetical protein
VQLLQAAPRHRRPLIVLGVGAAVLLLLGQAIFCPTASRSTG